MVLYRPMRGKCRASSLIVFLLFAGLLYSLYGDGWTESGRRLLPADKSRDGERKEGVRDILNRENKEDAGHFLNSETVIEDAGHTIPEQGGMKGTLHDSITNIKTKRMRIYEASSEPMTDHRHASIVPTKTHDDPVFHPRFWDAVIEFSDGLTFVKTGDIKDMWIRDSSAQMWNAAIRSTDKRTLALIVRVLNMQAYFIHEEPYANSYSLHWRDPKSLPRSDRKLNRGNWVATYNFELDSGAYFVRLLHRMWLDHPDLINLKGPFENAIQTWLQTISTEQNHENSKYSYVELQRSGKGPPVKITGLTWSCYRPSDDKCLYAYNIPGNLFAALAFHWIAELYEGLRTDIVEVANRIRTDILAAVEKHGIYEEDGVRRYCYEVDGIGGCNKMDDANVPSLLSLPYVDEDGLTYDATIYKNTRKWILSSANPHYFAGSALRGIGSPHTKGRNVWPMGLLLQGFTSTSETEQREMHDMVVKSMGGGKHVHESVDVNRVGKWTRKWFGWADVLWKEYQDRFHF